MGSELGKVDHSALRVNQGVIILGLLASFILNVSWLPALVALVMLIGTILRRPGFFFIYRGILRPFGMARPDVREDNPEPHRFAQGFGGVVAGLASVLLFLGSSLAGWALVWVVAVLAALNLFLGFCAGCAVYYWLHRLQVPGFVKSPPPRTLPGMRPRT